MLHDDFTVVHPCAAGLDVHKLQITATIRRQTATTEPTTDTREFSALPHGLADLCAWLRREGVNAALLEGTGVYWQAPSEALEDAGVPVTLVNAHQVKQLKGRKTDVADSVWLARVCQFGLASPSMVPPRHFRELRHLSRHRRRLVQMNASVRNRVHKVLDRSGCRLGGALSDIFGVNGRRVLDGLVAGESRDAILKSLSSHVRQKLKLLGEVLTMTPSAVDIMLLKDLLAEHDALQRRRDEFERTLVDGLAPWHAQLNLLRTIPGIDRASACDILAEIGPDLDVFGSVKHLAAWAGVCPGNHESAGKRKHASARNGSRHLRAVLNQCAHAAARTKDCQFQGYHKAMTVRRGYKRAIVATAHKLLRTIWALLRQETPYRDPEIDYEALVVDRNAPRWQRLLIEHGYVIDGKVVWPT